jgi:hypothetical protein
LATEKVEAPSQDESQSIIDDICHAIKKRMEKVITEKSARNRAKFWSGAHQQSRKGLTLDTIFSNLLTGKQQLPARPRDFRLNLSEEERTIDYGELSDVLAGLVRLYILDAQRDKLPMTRGRPNSAFSPERRGRFSYYDFSILKKQINNIIKEPSIVGLIDDRLLRDDILYRFVKYSIASAFHQAKENEHAFLNKFRPYGLKRQQLDLNREIGGEFVPFKEMSQDKLNELAAGYAIKGINELKNSNIPLVYEIVILLQIIDPVL